MNESQFNDLLDRYNKGLCTEEEKQSLERWLDNIKEGAGPFKSNAEMLKVKSLSLSSVFNIKAGIEDVKTRILFPVWAKVAASVALLVVALYGVWTFSDFGKATVEQITYTSANDIVKKILPDNTIAWIKPGASLTWHGEVNGERHVSFQGEVLFEVAKDSLKPFTASYGDLNIKVLGTSFNIKPSASGIEVLVLTGKVSLSAKGSTSNLIVLPNEKALYVPASQHLAKVEAAKEEPVKSIEGTEYDMAFKNSSIGLIVDRIERKFNVKVNLSDKNIRNCVLSADFTDQSLDRTLNLISETLDYKYEINGNTVTVTGSGCQ